MTLAQKTLKLTHTPVMDQILDDEEKDNFKDLGYEFYEKLRLCHKNRVNINNNSKKCEIKV